MLPAVAWLFKRLAELVFGPALVLAVAFAYERDWKDMGISLGVSAAAFVYWMAMYTKKDLTP